MRENQMSIRTVSLLATAGIFAAGAPLAAQDSRYASLPADVASAPAEMVTDDVLEVPSVEVEIDEQDPIADSEEYAPEDMAPEEMAEVIAPDPVDAHLAAPARQLGYTEEQRDAWLTECRLLYSRDSYYDRGYYGRGRHDDDADGGIIGGLLGAVIGGIAGNRIADGERLGGTLIGAGLGGLAGAVIGSAIDAADGDDDYDYHEAGEDSWASQYCNAYLRRYEAGATAGHYTHAAYAQPVMMVARQRGHHHGPQCREQCREAVREEWVDAPAARPARRSIPPRPQSGKLTPIK